MVKTRSKITRKRTGAPPILKPDGSTYYPTLTQITVSYTLLRKGQPLGRPEKDFWHKLRPSVFKFLREHGYGQHGDLAKLERHMARWIKKNNCSASKNTIRDHAKTLTKEFEKKATNRS